MEEKTCSWYMSILRTRCGYPAVETIKVKTRTLVAEVPLCELHSALHDQNTRAQAAHNQRMAQARLATKK